MRERVFDNELIIDIDNNGDNYQSFKKSVEFIRSTYSISEKNYYSGFFGDSFFHFDHKGVFIKIIFSGFMGTEIVISQNNSVEDKSEFRKLAKTIIQFIATSN